MLKTVDRVIVESANGSFLAYAQRIWADREVSNGRLAETSDPNVYRHGALDTVARLARGKVDVLDFVESVDDLGIPTLSHAAPDVCENV